ncbi:hypothetical protein [Clostridium estertheticum]|uniref:hypothetical protein n=1 Tax=Clostridium estertheticum TaxID=238834 RepID=UPI0014788AE9|nr:hypothetical protein [Clostridium estertheticum]MBZ9615317.1 hypothetical protein [Clostridium estertheticum subsp. laramiense]WAG75206.1 hypothetical protein LL032_07075 [Clostridium estertheticum]
MDAAIKQKRDAMVVSQKLIPIMTDEEIGLIGFALKQTIDRLIKEGHVIGE